MHGYHPPFIVSMRLQLATQSLRMLREMPIRKDCSGQSPRNDCGDVKCVALAMKVGTGASHND